MNKKEYRFIDKKLLELVENNIISTEQYKAANRHFGNTKKEGLSITTIFTAIGVLLMALSIITIFAFNWDNIPKEIKIIASFVPITITAFMMYLCIKDDNKKMKLYTSIFAPVSIVATNSLISQIFHIQIEIPELFFISLIMFLPIAFILRNYISIIVYGIGTIIYSGFAMNTYSTDTVLLNSIMISIPLFAYNIINYVKDRTDSKNVIMWIINIILLTMLLFFKEIFRADVLLIYFYTIYFITTALFKEDNSLTKLIGFLFTAFLIISCIDSSFVSYAEDLEFGLDTLFLTLVASGFIFLSKAYEKPKEYFLFIFIFFMQYSRMPSEVLFMFVNLIAICLGVYKIVIGNKENLYREIMQGVSIVLLLILFRFMNSDLDFISKSIMFLITGAIFIASANVMKKRIGGK